MAVSGDDIAIVGMATRFPGARTPAEFWSNVRAGVESIRPLSQEQLTAAGVTRTEMNAQGYVPAAAVLDQMEFFDAEFFGLSPMEAAVMDPQHRQLLEACWEAFEDAGHPPERFQGAIGVFAGCGMNSYFTLNLLSNPHLVRDVGLFLLRHLGNDKDFLATRVSYLLDLRGPSVNVQTACSTSLVATHMACQSLLSGECDMALAGGSTIEIPHGRGYRYAEGEILSPDGHCRAFDERAQGTVFGSGAGVVVLRRLQDALDDGDRIYAVIKGTAVNNDGAQKVGFLAPSVDGQAACVAEALAVAGVDPDAVSYIECHGTGTPMGDPIEVAALTQAFRESTDAIGFCAIGSVKTNIGHLDTAAGIAGLIKVALSIHHGELPATLNHTADNPNIDFATSPFYVNDDLRDWVPTSAGSRFAGVNSLGVGGTNAFAILSDPPPRTPATEVAPTRTPDLPIDTPPWHLLVVSGKSRAALDDNSRRLAAHLRHHPELCLSDVARTLRSSRRAFAERRVLVARDTAEAVRLLETADARVHSHSAPGGARSVAFMFPGGGTQHARMAATLYRDEPTFARQLDQGLRLLRERHGLDLTDLLVGDCGHTNPGVLSRPSVQLPAIFLVEYALAQLLIAWGIVPTALVGHSIGENTAACVAGTMSFADCLGLVVLRGRLLERTAGVMTMVSSTPEDLTGVLLELGLDVAAINSEDLCVVSGEPARVAAFEARMRADGVEPHRVGIDTAAHSRALEPVLAEFGAYLAGIVLRPPSIPWVSNRTGCWITDAEAVDPTYWVDQFRHTVRFSDCLTTLAADAGRIFLEVGPGTALSSLAQLHPRVRDSRRAVPTLRRVSDETDDNASLLTAVGRLWALGYEPGLDHVGAKGLGRHIDLPTYAFQSQPFFIDPGVGGGEPTADDILERDEDEDRWFWQPFWKCVDADEPVEEAQTWLVFRDQLGVAEELTRRLEARGDVVTSVRFGDAYHRVSESEYVIAVEEGRYGYDELLRDLRRTGRLPDRVVHLALLASSEEFRPGSSFFHRNQEFGFYSLLFFAQAWSGEGLTQPLHVVVATVGAQRVLPNDDVPWPEQATAVGPARVIPNELPNVTVVCVDIDRAQLRSSAGVRRRFGRAIHRALASTGAAGAAIEQTPRAQLLDALHRELVAPPQSLLAAIRGDRRYVYDVRRGRTPDETPSPAPAVAEGAVVLITGGLGGIGLTLADHLATTRGAKLALLSRHAVPERGTWDDVELRLGALHPLSRRLQGLRRLESIGAEYEIVEADVADLDAMTAAMERIVARFGRLDVVIHAAGVIDDNLLALKTHTGVEKVLSPKLYGTNVLETVTANQQLDLFVVFSSTSAMTGAPGQVDYAAASNYLNCFVHGTGRRDDVRYLSIAWGVWNGVGMASVQRGTGGGPTITRPATQPWFSSVSAADDDTWTLMSRWTTDDHWFLDHHRTADHEALLPGSAYLELARQALAEVGVELPFEMRGLSLLRPLSAVDHIPLTVFTRLTPVEDGYELALFEGVHTAETAAGELQPPLRWRMVAQAQLVLADVERPPPIDVPARAACTMAASRSLRQAQHLHFGAQWDVIRDVRHGGGFGIARIAVPAALGAGDDHALHPGAFDLATGFAIELVPGYSGDRLWVPVECASIRVFEVLPQSFVSVATVLPGSAERSDSATFDVDLCADDGRVLVAVRGFTMRRLDGGLNLAAIRRVVPTDLEPETTSSNNDARSSQFSSTFVQNMVQGINPAEGVRAFDHALQRGETEVQISAINPRELRRQTSDLAETLTRPITVGASTLFSRPRLEQDYVAPRNDVEATLADFWQELLGIDQVGICDSFFDLGGHSIIAVRFFAKIRRSFGVDLPISVLFEAPTIEACARLLEPHREDGEPSRSESAGASASRAVTRSRLTHVVAMNDVAAFDDTPLFMAAGMFGNVLNLRQLAEELGTHRRFYGLQARGLFGGTPPHETFESMATDYLAEIRQIQPDGPYLLGGFSGGGVVAFEMARQLRALGEKVDGLIMLDTPAPLPTPRMTFRERVRFQLDNHEQQGMRYLTSWPTRRLAWERARRAASSITEEQPEVLHSAEIEAAFRRALAAYRVRPYDGVITLLRPKLQPTHVFSPTRRVDDSRNFLFDDNRWGGYCRRVDVIEVPGTHDSMVLQPNVSVLARHIDRVLSSPTAARR